VCYHTLSSFPTRRSSDLTVIAGTLLLNGNSAFSGVTSVNLIFGGTLELGNAGGLDRINDSAPIHLNGGILHAGDITEAFGPLLRSEEHTSELQSRSDLVC